jgi:soluble lytic murein transglycosylase-like protein
MSADTAFRVAPVVVPTDIWTRCKISGPQYGLTASLLAALAWKESAFDQYAWNPEPRYPYLVDARTLVPFRKLTEDERKSEIPPADFHALRGDADQEWWAQQAELVKIDVNLDLAARHLARQIARFGSAADGLSAYNAGSPVEKNRGGYVLPILRVADTIAAQRETA